MKKNILGNALAVFFILLVVLLNMMATIMINMTYNALPSILGLLKFLTIIITMGGMYTFYLKEKLYGSEKTLREEINSRIFLIMYFFLFIGTYFYYYIFKLNSFIGYYQTISNVREAVGDYLVNLAIIFQIIFALIFITFVVFIIYTFFFQKGKNFIKPAIILSIVLSVIYLLSYGAMILLGTGYIPFDLSIVDVLVFLILIFLIQDSIIAYCLIIFTSMATLILKLNLVFLDIIGGMWISLILNISAIFVSVYILTYAVKIFYRRIKK